MRGVARRRRLDTEPMCEHATLLPQFVGVGNGLRRRPRHITIGTHEHSRGGHRTAANHIGLSGSVRKYITSARKAISLRDTASAP